MMTRFVRRLAACAVVATAAMAPAETPSPHDHGGAELDPERAPIITPGQNPVHVATVITDEASLFGYAPRFAPGRVTFDNQNRPYIRVGFKEAEADGTEPPAFGYVRKGYIQTLGDDGRWQIIDFTGAIRQRYPEWEGGFAGGPFSLEAVFFDAANTAYTLVEAGKVGNLLLSSTDGMKTWDIDQVTGRRPSIEMWQGYNDRSQPPAILSSDGNKLYLTLPQRRPDGTLDVPEPVVVRELEESGRVYGGGTANHSGATNAVVSYGGKVHVVWAESIQVPSLPEATPQYVATYDRERGVLSEPLLLGGTLSNTTKQADGHNVPSILVDSKGYLHVMMGSHQKPFRYTRSLRPNDATAWSEPVDVSNPDPRGHETYVGMLVDPDDTLHLVSRVVDNDGYSLHYMRRKTGDATWKEMGKLVKPPHFPYSIYYHKVSMDRRGRLFVAYTHWTKFHLADAELFRETYPHTTIWPSASVDGKRVDAEQGNAMARANPRGSWLYHNAVRHWAILMSDDGGDSWRLATTPDFAQGMPGNGNNK